MTMSRVSRRSGSPAYVPSHSPVTWKIVITPSGSQNQTIYVSISLSENDQHYPVDLPGHQGSHTAGMHSIRSDYDTEQMALPLIPLLLLKPSSPLPPQLSTPQAKALLLGGAVCFGGGTHTHLRIRAIVSFLSFPWNGRDPVSISNCRTKESR